MRHPHNESKISKGQPISTDQEIKWTKNLGVNRSEDEEEYDGDLTIFLTSVQSMRYPVSFLANTKRGSVSDAKINRETVS